MTGFTIAIDGPAAAGKGTIARALAVHFGFGHLDTGLLYRAVGRRVIQGEKPIAAAKALLPDDLRSEEALRTAEVARFASKAAAIPEVREALVDFQRAFAHRAGGAVLDGRDIGTVICPDAEVKLFVTATDDVRATRRFAELSAKGHDVTLDGVAHDLRIRDARDAERATAPLQVADDAVVLDTSTLPIEDAVARAIDIVSKARVEWATRDGCE